MVPEEHSWESLRQTDTKVNQALNKAFDAIVKTNPNKLGGVFRADFVDADALDDGRLSRLVERLSTYNLSAKRVPPNMLGEAYMDLVRAPLRQRGGPRRWGSYSQRTGTLSLNFRVLMAPADIIDYVIAHAEHSNHGPRFWRLVENHVPDHEAKNEWLKENGTQLIFTGTSL